MHKSFSFKGVARHTDNLLSQEGECIDVVNLRMVNGSLSPVPVPTDVVELRDEYTLVRWHEFAGCYLCVTATGELHPYDKEWKQLRVDGEPLRFEGLGNIERVELLGNLVCCFTDTSICYVLYDSGIYRLLGDRPPMPVLEIKPESKVQRLTTDSSYYVNTTVSNLEASWKYNEKGYIDECISTLNKEGYYIDRALFRFALRLYDGSYIYCSHIIHLCDTCSDDEIARDARNMQSESLGSDDGLAQFRVKVRGFKPGFEFKNLSLDAWKGIVVGIDLFSTSSITGKQVESALRTQSNPETGIPAHHTIESYVAKKPIDLWNDISNASIYYKIAEFDIEGNLLFAVDDVSPTNLALQQSLTAEVTSSTLATLSADCSYMFNNRLHIASLKEWLFKGYDASSLSVSSANDYVTANITTHTVIETTSGTITVVNEMANKELCCNNGIVELSPLLSYPDARATSLRIYIDDGESIVTRSFPLTAHNNLNIAQYVHKWSSMYDVSVEARFANGGNAASISDSDALAIFGNKVGVYEVVYSQKQGCWTYNGNKFPEAPYDTLRIFGTYRNIADGDKLVFTISEKDYDDEFSDVYNIVVDSKWETVDAVPVVDTPACETRANVVKVSQVDNPFVFPAAATYTPTQGRVLAMSSNTAALSQGQFGQHPLYLFCSDGIWALSSDTSGSIAYAGCFPLSREKCINPVSVCGVDGGVVFVGEKGLMLLHGSSLKKMSVAMEESAGVSQLLASPLFERIASLVNLADCRESDTFENYIARAKVAYLAANNEIVVANGNYKYVYIFSLAHGVWSRISVQMIGFVNDNSCLMFFSSGAGATRVSAFATYGSGSNRFMLMTRPLLWGTKLPKRVMQLMLHSRVLPAGKSGVFPLLASYLLCSNDGVNFKLVAGCEKNSEFCDLPFPYYPTQSYRYFLFAIVGEADCRSCLTGFELDVSAAWNNRMK